MKTLLALLALHAAAPNYVVHEWGTFTAVVGEDGKPIWWNPLEWHSDLPSFVHTCAAGGKGGFPPSTIRMETPVLYFYPQREMSVAVKVGFPQGAITEVYPGARHCGWGEVDWGTVKLLPKGNALLPVEPAHSHYYPARNVDAALVQVGNEVERDLFYRGIGTFPLPLTVTLQGKTLHFSGERAASLVFERTGDALGVAVIPAGATSIDRPALTATPAQARDALYAALLGAGLYDREAKAMLDTWDDAWFEPGLRVFSIVPRANVDALLPLTLSPAPAEVQRVIVSRIEILSADRQAQALASPETTMKREGRFAGPLFQLVRSKATPAQLARIDQATLGY